MDRFVVVRKDNHTHRRRSDAVSQRTTFSHPPVRFATTRINTPRQCNRMRGHRRTHAGTQSRTCTHTRKRSRTYGACFCVVMKNRLDANVAHVEPAVQHEAQDLHMPARHARLKHAHDEPRQQVAVLESPYRALDLAQVAMLGQDVQNLAAVHQLLDVPTNVHAVESAVGTEQGTDGRTCVGRSVGWLVGARQRTTNKQIKPSTQLVLRKLFLKILPLLTPASTVGAVENDHSVWQTTTLLLTN